MNLYIVKSKPNLDHFPSPNDLMNIDFFFDIEKLDINPILPEINKYLRQRVDFVCNLSDIQMLKDKGFTILWVSGGIFLMLFDLDNHNLVDFKRDFKLRQILTI